MAQRMVHCAKLDRLLPGLDESTPDGRRALDLALMLGGPALRDRVREHVSAEAWHLWKDRMLMVMNEFHLDPASEQADAILREHLEAFLFGPGQEIPNYRPPSEP